MNTARKMASMDMEPVELEAGSLEEATEQLGPVAMEDVPLEVLEAEVMVVDGAKIYAQKTKRIRDVKRVVREGMGRWFGRELAERVVAILMVEEAELWANVSPYLEVVREKEKAAFNRRLTSAREKFNAIARETASWIQMQPMANPRFGPNQEKSA